MPVHKDFLSLQPFCRIGFSLLFFLNILLETKAQAHTFPQTYAGKIMNIKLSHPFTLSREFLGWRNTKGDVISCITNTILRIPPAAPAWGYVTVHLSS